MNLIQYLTFSILLFLIGIWGLVLNNKNIRNIITFNYLSFFLVIYVSHSFLQSIDHQSFMDLLEKLLIIISVITIYIYTKQ